MGRIIDKRNKVHVDDRYENDTDYKHSYDTPNRGYKLYAYDDDEDDFLQFFAYIHENTHYIYDFTQNVVYPKFYSSGLTLQYPSLQYRSCVLMSTYEGCIFVPTVKCLAEYTMGFYVRALIFNGLKKVKYDENCKVVESVVSEGNDNPLGHVSPIYLTTTNIYPITSGMTSHSGGSSSPKGLVYYSKNYDPNMKSNYNSIASKYDYTTEINTGNLNFGKVNNYLYMYEVAANAKVFGWRNFGIGTVSNEIARMSMVDTLLKCTGWTVLSFTAYMIVHATLLSASASLLNYKISPIFFPNIIFYPIPYNNITTYNTNICVESFFKVLKANLDEVKDSSYGEVSIKNENLIISPLLKGAKNESVYYNIIKNIPLRPLCFNVSHRGFLPYYL